MVAETVTEGDWVHLDPADWIDDPHVIDPQETLTA